jgi:guanylate kinase
MNALKHRSEFQSILASYQLSPSAKETLAQTPIVLLVGPTSAGRNTIITALLKTNEYYYLVSDTTREMREKDGLPIEKDGREYWFRNEDEILADIRAGEFLEAAVIHEQQVSGISIREIEKARQTGKIAITDVEPHGAEWIHQLKPDAQIIFVVPPNFDDWIARFRRRSDLPEDEIRRRLETACNEMRTALSSDYYLFLVNDKLEAAIAGVYSLTKRGDRDVAQAAAARAVVERLYQDTMAYLQS